MSISHPAIRAAVRTQAATLVVCTTGSATLGADVTSSSYTRASGSFLADGFEPGMELVATGFVDSANNGPATITEVGALTLGVDKTLVTVAAAAAKTLAVGLPATLAKEDEEFSPEPGVPWIEEEFVSGPQRRVTTDRNGLIEFDPVVNLWVHVPANSGSGALERYADALLSTFKANTNLTLSTGDVGWVRSEVGPYRGPIRHYKSGFASVRVTMNLRFRLTP